MTIKEFSTFLEKVIQKTKSVLDSKCADYSDGIDKLYNFKHAAEIDGITPVEALRGMWLKHRASVAQGLDDLLKGKVRSEKWWEEKLTDDRNYSILLQALLDETYFAPKRTTNTVDNSDYIKELNKQIASLRCIDYDEIEKEAAKELVDDKKFKVGDTVKVELDDGYCYKKDKLGLVEKPKELSKEDITELSALPFKHPGNFWINFITDCANKKSVKTYLSHSMRGRKGNAATSEEIDENCKRAGKIAKQIQYEFPELELYDPTQHERFAKKIWESKKLEKKLGLSTIINMILDADCEIVKECDLLLVLTDEDGFISDGVQREIDAADKVKIRKIIFSEVNNLIEFLIRGTIHSILEKK